MRSSLFYAALCATSTSALPWMTPEGMGNLLNHPEARKEINRRMGELRRGAPEQSHHHEARQLGTGLLNGVGTLVDGTLGAILDNVLGLIPTPESVKGLKRFPEADHPFQPPGPTDQRGPCPGLNTLANHGYIPRTGIATIGQINAATARVFNMGADLSTVLATIGAIETGDILSQTMSIGGPDSRVGLLNGALNNIFGTPSGISGHGKADGDASATRNDFYLGGDDISFQPELFKQLHQQALARGNGTYSVAAVQEHFKNRYAASRAANSQFYFNVPGAAFVMGAYYFIPGFFSNGTIGAGGVANEASVTSFYGARPDSRAGAGASDDPGLTYTHVPERIPEAGWYRRATPMTVAEAVGGILDIYLYAQPALGGSGADQSWVAGPVDLPTSPQGLSCFLYNAVFAIFPSELYGSVALLETVVNAVSGLVAPGYKALGCDINFPNAAGSDATRQWQDYVNKYVGPAKTQATGSGWYKAP